MCQNMEIFFLKKTSNIPEFVVYLNQKHYKSSVLFPDEIINYHHHCWNMFSTLKYQYFPTMLRWPFFSFRIQFRFFGLMAIHNGEKISIFEYFIGEKKKQPKQRRKEKNQSIIF